jgi:hypothetical protein
LKLIYINLVFSHYLPKTLLVVKLAKQLKNKLTTLSLSLYLLTHMSIKISALISFS